MTLHVSGVDVDLSINNELIKSFSTGKPLAELCHQKPLQEHLNKTEDIISYQFTEKSFLCEALFHPSFLNELPHKNYQSNQRLEFLGDSILNLIVSNEIFFKYKRQNEGVLSKLRASCVNEVSLYQIADVLKISPYIFTGKGERVHLSQSFGILSDVLESLIGAVFLDSSLDVVSKLFQRWVEKLEENFHQNFYDLERLSFFDPKSSLQERVLKRFSSLPEYRSSDLGDGKFKVELYIDQKKVSDVTMNSKKLAEKFLASEYIKNHYKEK